MEWFRWYHGTVADPKFSIIAKRSKQPRHVVVACWPALLEYTSSRDDRGSLEGIDLEEIAVVLDLDLDQVEAIYQAMVDKGMIELSRVSNWEKRQPSREDETAKERKERWKQNQSLKAQEERTGTQEERKGTQEERTGTQKERKGTQEERTGTQKERKGTHGTGKTLEQNREEQIKPKTSSAAASSQASTTPTPSAPVGQQQQPGKVVTFFADSENQIRTAFRERHDFLAMHFPHLNLAVEEEQCALRYRSQPLKFEAGVVVMEWCKRVPVGKPDARSRDRPSRQEEAVQRGLANHAVAMEAIYAAEGV